MKSLFIMSVAKSYTFYLNSIKAQSKTGADINFVLPTNLILSNASNSFVAYVSEASIPNFKLPISAAYGNNTIRWKLQVYVDYGFLGPSGQGNYQQIEQWMDATEVQQKFITPNASYMGVSVNSSCFAQNLQDPAAPPLGNWCDNRTVTVPDGVYLTPVALATAVNTAWQASITSFNADMNYMAPGIGSYWASSRSRIPPAMTTYPIYPSGGGAWLMNFSVGLTQTNIVNAGSVYQVIDVGTTTLGQWQELFSGLSSIPVVGQWITCTQSGAIPNGAIVIQVSGTSYTTATLSNNNCFGWQSQFGDPSIQPNSIRFLNFKQFRIYVYENEIMSMLGWPDTDFTFDSSFNTPVYIPTGFSNGVPNYYTAGLSINFSSFHEVDVNPNNVTYITCSSITQSNAMAQDPLSQYLVNTNALCAVYTDNNNSSVTRSNVYFSFPIKIQIMDKSISYITIVLKDYRNRSIPYNYFPSPVFLELVIEEVVNTNPQNQSLNLQQFYDQEAAFFRQKELELALQFESFIRDKR